MDIRLVIIPCCFKGEGFCDTVSGTIKTLDVRNLRSIAKVFKGSIQELEDYFIYLYPNRENIYICKKDRLIYAEHNNKETQKQAWHFMRALAHFGYIEEFKRIRQRRKYYSPYKGHKYIKTYE